MTHMAKLMEFSRIVENGGKRSPLFDFPGRVVRSVRFGAHGFIAGETMQIIPIRKDETPDDRKRFPSRNEKKRDGGARIFASVPGEYLRNFGSWFDV